MVAWMALQRVGELVVSWAVLMAVLSVGHWVGKKAAWLVPSMVGMSAS